MASHSAPIVARTTLRHQLAGAAALAALVGVSLLVVAPAPSYDPWSWLLWGREMTEGGLDTREGPAFKPLPVAITAVLAPTGGAAPVLWVALVRAAALIALWLAFRLGRDLGGGSRLAGGLAAVAVALCGGFLGTAAAGAETPVVLALGLGAVEAWRRERFGWVLAAAIGVVLLRVEAWPFALAAGVILWHRRPELRQALAAAAVLVPAAWLLPELAGSGDPLRGASRARVPNPGQPALADVPALAALDEAVDQLLWPLWIGVLVLAVEAGRSPRARAALVPVAAGAAWIALVAAMAPLGFSGEARYSLPGAALVALGGAVGLAGGALPRRTAAVASVALAVVALSAVARVDELADVHERQQHAWDLHTHLDDAIAAAGGRAAVLRCGQPYVGRLRGPLMAYHLAVRKRTVEPDDRPRPPGVVFRSALQAGDPLTPAVGPRFHRIGRDGPWETWRAC